MTIFSIDFRSDAIEAACACPCDATDRRTASSRRDVDFGLTAENAEDPLKWESPNKDDESEETDDGKEDAKDDDSEQDKEEDNAADKEGADEVDK